MVENTRPDITLHICDSDNLMIMNKYNLFYKDIIIKIFTACVCIRSVIIECRIMLRLYHQLRSYQKSQMGFQHVCQPYVNQFYRMFNYF